MKLENPEYLYDDGYPMLSVYVDGKRATFLTEQKFLHTFGIVIFDESSMFSEYKATIPANPRNGIPEPEVVTGSDDPVLVELVRRFWFACNDGTFKPGPVSLPELIG